MGVAGGRWGTHEVPACQRRRFMQGCNQAAGRQPGQDPQALISGPLALNPRPPPPSPPPSPRRYGTASTAAAKPAVKVKAHTPSAEEAEKAALLAAAALGDKLDSECVGCAAKPPAMLIEATCCWPAHCRMRAGARACWLCCLVSKACTAAGGWGEGEGHAAPACAASPLGLTCR